MYVQMTQPDYYSIETGEVVYYAMWCIALTATTYIKYIHERKGQGRLLVGAAGTRFSKRQLSRVVLVENMYLLVKYLLQLQDY